MKISLKAAVRAFLALSLTTWAVATTAYAKDADDDQWRKTQRLFFDTEYDECIRRIDLARAAKSPVFTREAEALLLRGICEERLGRFAEADGDYAAVESKFLFTPQSSQARFRLQRQAADQKGWIQPPSTGTKWIQTKMNWDATNISGVFLPRRSRGMAISGGGSFLTVGASRIIGGEQNASGGSANEDSSGATEVIETFATDHGGRDFDTWGPVAENRVAAKCADVKWTPVQASDTEIIEMFQTGDCESRRRSGVLRMLLKGSRVSWIVYSVQGRQWTTLLQRSSVKLVSSARYIDPVPEAPK